MVIHKGPEQTERVPVRTLGGVSSSSVFRIVIVVKLSAEEYTKHRVYVVKPVLLPVCKLPDNSTLTSIWPTLDEKIVEQIEQNKVAEPDLMMGLDNYYNVVTGTTLIHHSCDYADVKIIAGWSIRGIRKPPTDHEAMQSYLTQLGFYVKEKEPITCEKDTELIIKESLEKFFAIEEDDDGSQLTSEELYVENLFQENIRYKVGEKVVVSPLVKPDAPKLTSNVHFAMARFNGVNNSLKRNPTKDKIYREAIEKMLEN